MLGTIGGGFVAAVTGVAPFVGVALLVRGGRNLLTSVADHAGEWSVIRLLKELPGDQYVVLHDVMIPTPDKSTTRIDHLVVSLYGIFVIRTLNMDGTVSGAEEDERWTHTLYGRKNLFANPLQGNDIPVRSLMDLLDLPDRAFRPMVVFTGRCERQGEYSQPVMGTEQLLDAILGWDKPCFSRKRMRDLADRIRSIELTGSWEA